jgi:hypothetical protein
MWRMLLPPPDILAMTWGVLDESGQVTAHFGSVHLAPRFRPPSLRRRQQPYPCHASADALSDRTAVEDAVADFHTRIASMSLVLPISASTAPRLPPSRP